MNEMSTKFQLTADNYYSDEANREYLSVSQFKDFVGTYGRMGCEEMALAKIRGEYKTEHNIERIKQLKEGTAKPDRCNTCGWCRQTKVLKRPISIMDLTASI